MAKKTTSDLGQELMAQPDLKSYLSENEELFTTSGVGEALAELHKGTGLTKAELARRAGMSEVYFHQVISGRRSPSRDRLLCICVSAGAGLEEVNQLLKQAGYAQLYPRQKRDAIISHGLIYHRQLSQINEALFAEDEKTLS